MLWIYLLTNRINGKKYVGQDCQPPRRFKQHCWPSAKLAIDRAIQKHGKENFDYELIDSSNDQKEIDDMETFYIKKHNSLTPNGYNILPGPIHFGKVANYLSTKAKKEKGLLLIQPILDLYNDGHSLREISEKIGLGKDTISKKIKEFSNIKKLRCCYSHVQVFQYDIKGNFIKHWESQKVCAESLKIDVSNLVAVLKGRQSTCKGFYFSYEELEKKEVIELMKQKADRGKESLRRVGKRSKLDKITKNIKQLDLDGNLIKVWESSREIVDFYNLKSCDAVTRVVRGERKTFMGFKWLADPLKNSITTDSLTNSN